MRMRLRSPLFNGREDDLRKEGSFFSIGEKTTLKERDDTNKWGWLLARCESV